jgi:hypothetical protein
MKLWEEKAFMPGCFNDDLYPGLLIKKILLEG